MSAPDELDRLCRQWNIDILGDWSAGYFYARAYRYERGLFRMVGVMRARTPLSAARKLARRLEKEMKL